MFPERWALGEQIVPALQIGMVFAFHLQIEPAIGGDAMFTGLQDFINDPADIDGVLGFIENVAAGIR